MSYFIVTGGGTGGHVFPAVTIATELIRRGHQVLYVGSDRGMENRIVPEQGIALKTFRTSGIKNQSPIKILKSAFLLFVATCRSIWMLLLKRPQAVIGVGGYVSAPMCFAAFVLRIPLYLQEQNVSVGLANRALGKLCTKVFLGFEEAKKYFPQGKSIATGNPLRPEFFQKAFPAYNPSAGKLLVMGGSQGARAINQAVVDLLGSLPAVEIIHQTGISDLQAVQDSYRQSGFKGKWQVVPFIKAMDEAYGSASLVICRSGALTVSELIATGRPSLLVPFPRKGQNDQTANAYFLQNRNLAKVVEQGEGFSQRFREAFLQVFQPSTLQGMAAGFSQLHRPDALASICDHIEGKTRSLKS
jgi:UDP-N-acetylglucosamine--N-acetylmuramyl-(pentapeptide) pyrophosphoryl-undecaprenol N-acetylglucosamine transferase